MSDSDIEIPGKSSGAGLYIAGIVVMGAGIVALLVWRSRSAPPPQVISVATTTATVTAAAPPPPMFAPPPPPKIEVEPEPTATAATPSGPGAKTTAAAAGGPNPCAKCGEGESSSALNSALSGAAGGAQACYQRALQKSEASGKINVSVQVGSTGSVCGAAITSDTVGNPAVSSCVLGRFQGRSFPPPKSGCVVVNVPLNFTFKQ